MEQLNFITNILGINDKNIIILVYLDAGTHKEVIAKLDYPPSPASDFAQNISDILDGKEPNLTWTEQGVTLGVVVASEGYPLAYEKGVELPEKTSGDIITYYAGAKFAENGKALLSNGGRVYMLVTTADTVKAAQDKIYAQIAQQNTDGLFYRTDIGSKAL